MNKNKRFVSMQHPAHPGEFVLLMTDGNDATHWMAADGTWIAFSDDMDVAATMFAGLPGSGLLPKWDESYVG
jgi:hypothetical protein